MRSPQRPVGIGGVLRCPHDLRRLRPLPSLDVRACPARHCGYRLTGLDMHRMSR